MIAAVVVFGECPLGVNRASEFAAPDDQRVVQHAALLEVFQQRVTGLIDVLALAGHPSGDIGMMVPVVVIDLNESHAAFGQSSRHQDRVGKRARLLRFFAVQFEKCALVSLTESVSSGTLACMRKAISYC